MRVKRYQGPSLPETLRLVRQELGPEAVIVHSQKVRRGGLFGLFGQEMVEVVAAADDAPPALQTALQAIARAGAATASSDHGPAAPALARELQALRQGLRTLLERLDWPGLAKLPPALGQCYQDLLAQEVDPALAQDLVLTVQADLSFPALNDPERVRAAVRQAVAQRIAAAGPLTLTPGRPRVVFLIGPTGVGKTTTLAKLAANFTLERRRVALVTCDTFRIAAIPQLRTYAEIMGLTLTVAYTPAEVTSAVAEHLDKDLILIDTPGRSQYNRASLAELVLYVQAVPGPTVLLAVSAATRLSEMLAVVEHFGVVPWHGFVLTKLDETRTYGPLLSLLARTGKPVFYLTTGQQVPQDIEVASAQRLADLVGSTPAPLEARP